MQNNAVVQVWNMIGTLNGWKAIATYLRRDERTARRWAAEGGLPIHRMPGAGRGSVYAMAAEIDAWLLTDRQRVAELTRQLPAVIDVAPSVQRSALPWWRRRWVPGWLILMGAALVTGGMLTMHRSGAELASSDVVIADPAAKAMFLQAEYDWNLRTPESLTRAAQEYGDTIIRDPRVAPAYVGLANSYLLLREFGSLTDAEAYSRAEPAARAALALSPTSAEAHRALAFIAYWWHQDIATARREFARALKCKPDDALTHHQFAYALLVHGQANAALREIDRARDLDPTSAATLSDRGMILYVAGHRAEGLASLWALVREQPEAVGPHRSLGEIALFEGRQDEFLRQLIITTRLRSDAAGLAKAERWLSTDVNGERLEKIMLVDAKQANVGWFQIARLAAVAGRSVEAKNALARACNAREPDTISAHSDLWLSRALSAADVAERCKQVSLLS